MANYKDELRNMGISSYDPEGHVSDMLRFGQSLLKRRRGDVNRKASSAGIDPVSSMYAGDEGIFEQMLQQEGQIRDNAYTNQFREAGFLQDHKLKQAQIDEMQGSWLDDLFTGLGLGASLLDVTGAGAAIGSIGSSLFGKKK